METSSALKKAQYHAWFHHHTSDGFVTVARKAENGGFIQFHYKPSELASELTKWLGEDVFFSQNTFYKPQRSIETVRQLRSLYVDLDFYLFNYDPSWVINKLQHEYYGKTVPDPNIIIFSGQGIVLIWFIEPAPYKALPLWQAIQNHFIEQLSELGGDSKAADAARVFRIAGSINSKNGVEVRAEYRHELRYELRQIQYDYLPELSEVLKPSEPKRRGRKRKVVTLFKTYKLHYDRLCDLVRLVELRNYEVTGHRELICFLYRYWACCYLKDTTEALNQTHTLNLQFSAPLPLSEVERATRSAEKAYEARNSEEANRIAREKGYPGSGYNVTNKKLIEWLDISDDEMIHLQTIIGTKEKNRRKRIANMTKRREEGIQPREQYIKQQHDRTDEKLFKLQELLEQNPRAKRKQLADLIGVSVFRVDQLKRELKSL